jgi:hypothetical protein
MSGIAAQRFESTAFQVAQRYVASINLCDPASPDCFSQFVRTTGRELWRRPLTEAEVARYVALATQAWQALADPKEGFEFAVAALLQSPYFLYRVEVGEPDAVLLGRRRLSNHELATRLSFFLTAAPPDAELSASADAGTVRQRLPEHAERLLTTLGARDAAAAFLSEYLQLGPLLTTEKSAALFPSYDASLRAAMYQQTAHTLTELAFVEGLDFRQLFTTRRTFLTPQLAGFYGVDNSPDTSATTGAAPTAEALSPFEFAQSTPRVGLLSHASFLALNAHASSTSPTRRGKFVREVLLCQAVAPPPPGLVSELTTVDAAAKTSRERLKQHADNPACRDCHLLMDPIGLGFENFDAIGAFRETQNDAPIDPSGGLDGKVFDNAAQLSALIAEHPALTRCLVRTVFHQASGTLATPAEEPLLVELHQHFAEQGYSLPALLLGSASHPAFDFVREPSATAPDALAPGEAP